MCHNTRYDGWTQIFFLKGTKIKKGSKVTFCKLILLPLRECPYKNFSIQVPKFPRAHHQFLRDSTSIDPLAGLIWGGLGCPRPPQLFVQVEVSKFHILLNCYSFDHSFWHVELEDHKNLPTIFPQSSLHFRKHHSTRVHVRSQSSAVLIFVDLCSIQLFLSFTCQ